MAYREASATSNAANDARVALADGGTIEVYTGTQPATANDAATGTLLATLTLTTPAFAASAGGVAAIDADPDLETTAVADGTAGWARVLNSTGGTVFDGDVTTSGGGGVFTINATSVASGGTVKLLSGTVTQPSA